ncbi:MAG: FAD-dependent oxidoreductase [Steroidobacteraceae bacterium]
MTCHYPALFSPLSLRGNTLRNRIVHAAILTGFVQGGRIPTRLLNYYRSRAAGGAAMIVTEPLAMTRHNRISSRIRAWDEESLGQLQRAADVVQRGGALLVGQLQDPGRGRHLPGRNEQAIGASPLPDDLSWTVPQALSVGEIAGMIDDWARGAARLQRAGFAGVEISAGHGHLIHQFLSPHSNRREDGYGGELEGRTRFLRELIVAIRSSCAAGFIIGLKLPGDDGVNHSIDLDGAAAIAARLAKMRDDFDYWTWAWGAHARSLYRHLPDGHGARHPYLSDIARLRQSAPDVVTGAIGYLSDPTECEVALQSGGADLIFLGRPLITDPAFPNKARLGREAEIRHCVSCNSCWGSVIDGAGLACDNNPQLGVRDEHVFKRRRRPTGRSVAVVGSGIAGLEAAHTAARLGSKVILYGRSAQVGGKTRLHASLPGFQNLSSIYDYQWQAGQRAGVEFALGEDWTVDAVMDRSPEVILLAAGARASIPAWIEGPWQEPGLIPSLREIAWQLLGRTGRSPGRAVLIDQDHTAMTYAVAELMADRFERLTLVTSRERFASDVPLVVRQGIYQRLHDRRVEMLCNLEPRGLDGLEEGRLELANVYNQDLLTLQDVACITHASPRLPDQQWLHHLQALGADVRLIGDCRAPRSVMAATRDGYLSATELNR